MEQYKYAPLLTAKKQIRLFRFEADSGSSGKVGRLQAFDHSKCPSYRCLSYTWGHPDPTRNLVMQEDTYIEIRDNLWSFLEVLGERYFEEWIWIDQLCIDQNNITERSAQVQMMGDIYQQAKEVIVWLQKEPKLDSIYNQVSDPTALDPTSEQYGLLIEQLIENPYFDRLWVVQEMALAKSLKLCYRSLTIPWSKLQSYLDNPPAQFRNRTMQIKTKWLFAYAASAQPLQKAVMPLDTLQYFASSGCQDERDVIYALQGLWDVGDRQRVDYTRRTTTMFIELSLMLMTKFLSYAGLSERRPYFLLNVVATNMNLGVKGCKTLEEREAYFREHVEKFRRANNETMSAVGGRFGQI